MRWAVLLRGLFGVMLVAMIGLTVAASLDRGLMTAAGELWPHLWFRAPLADAYFAFLTVWLWIASRETTCVGRVVWLGLVLSLGSIAIAAICFDGSREWLAFTPWCPRDQVGNLCDPQAARVLVRLTPVDDKILSLRRVCRLRPPETRDEVEGEEPCRKLGPTSNHLYRLTRIRSTRSTG